MILHGNCLLALMGLILFSWLPTSLRSQEPTRYSRVVALVSRVENVQKLGSGFCVKYREKLFLVTARHTAADTNSITEVIVATEETVSPRMRLSEVAKVRCSNPWRNHSVADVSVCQLAEENLDPDIVNRLSQIAFSRDELELTLPPALPQLKL